jgi:hypothetical protein
MVELRLSGEITNVQRESLMTRHNANGGSERLKSHQSLVNVQKANPGEKVAIHQNGKGEDSHPPPNLPQERHVTPA